MELKDIIKPAITVPQTATFEEAVSLMIEAQTNSLLVINESGALVGEVNVTDLLDAVVPEYLEDDAIAAEFATTDMFANAIEAAKSQKVSDFMAKDMTVIEDNDSLMLAAQIAIKEKTARIPVVNASKQPVGIISRRGIKQLLADFLGIKDPN